MKTWLLLIVLMVAGNLSCCSRKIVTEPIYSYIPPRHKVSYEVEVKPILERRCVVCHSCYNSPCQLKFSSWEGIDRGASKERVYNADRLVTMEPSRLFIDAQSTSEWRRKGFFRVKPEEGDRKYDDSIMFLLLDHKRRNPSLIKTCGENENFKAEAIDLACPQTTAEVNQFLRAHPNRGMPFGFPPLSQDEFNLVVGWLTEGANGPKREELAERKAIPENDIASVNKWERFLNTEEPRYRLTARYLYEHLFLAHINFRPDSDNFYELVRSTTPPGEEINIIPTRRPYDSPGTTNFYYRFRKIHSILVHKTHMVFTMDKRQFELVDRLFIKTAWESGPYRMTFDKQISANPFESFKRIPVRSRYEWLLDNAHYIIMTFIRGPVCKGQVALNVVNDHFWLLFMNPDYDVSVIDPDFLEKYAQKLRMPTEKGSGLRLLMAKFSFKRQYKPWVEDYYQARQDKYAEKYNNGLGAEAIWIDQRGGNRDQSKAAEWERKQSFLTVFRHFDSASVHRGALGDLPKTAWVVDYPILERIYYSLVAGFDVYGTKGHQGATRKYMDSLRIEAESLFLEFMPKDVRKDMMDSWYQNLKEEKDLFYYPTEVQTHFPFSRSAQDAGPNTREQYKREFLEYYVRTMNLEFDDNYYANDTQTELPETYGGQKDWINGFHIVANKPGSFVKQVADHNANVAWVQVITDTQPRYLTIFVDRWHDNVNYMDDEEQMLDSKKDEVDVLKGLFGSYPNYFFVVKEQEMGDFLKVLYEYDGSNTDICRLETFGINRAEPEFWHVYDDFQKAFNAQHEERSGIIDLNRYYSLAMQKALYNGGTRYQCEAIAEQIEKDKSWWERFSLVDK